MYICVYVNISVDIYKQISNFNIIDLIEADFSQWAT